MKPYSVVTSYNFDPDTEVVLFPDEESANQYVGKRYRKCMENEKAEQATWDEDDKTLMVDECECHEDEGWATMVWSNEYTYEDPSRYDYCMWLVVPVTDPIE